MNKSLKDWDLKLPRAEIAYVKDEDFGELYQACQKCLKGDSLVQEGYLSKGTHLYIPKCSTRELLIWEVHGVSLADHYGENKTNDATHIVELYFNNTKFLSRFWVTFWKKMCAKVKYSTTCHP